jgi:hypothetical protein
MAEKYSRELQKKIDAEEEAQKKASLGLFADIDDDEHDAIDESRERAVERDMMGVSTTVHRFKIRFLSLSAFALLRHINSAFLTFTPLLSDDDRELLIELSKKRSRDEDQETKYVRLIAMAKAESELIQNPYLETLKFLAVMTNDISEEEAEELVFADDDGRSLRRAALDFGARIEGDEMDDITVAIGTRVSEAQESKVVPAKKKGPRHQAKKKKKATPTRRRSLRK